MLERVKKSEWFYPTAYSVWDEDEEHEAIRRVLASGRLTMGEEVEAFEAEFAAWHGVRHAIMVNSGSSANLVAVAAMFHRRGRPLRRGDKVVVPALAWSTTYAPLVQHGLELVVADCNEQWNVGQYHGEPAISLQIVCSILGNPAHYWAEAPWPIIEDNCESMGAVDLKGRRCGTRGLMNTFSLFWSHQLSAVEGGVVLTNDDECAMLCRMLRAHGWTRDTSPGRRFSEEYDFRLMGYNVRPTEMYAAAARCQLRKLDEFTRVRRANYATFRQMTSELPIRFPSPNGEQSPFGMQFEVETPATRSHLAETLRRAGVDCRLPTGGSLTRHYYGREWREKYHTPRADQIHGCGMFLGNGPLRIDAQMDRAVGVMRDVLRVGRWL